MTNPMISIGGNGLIGSRVNELTAGHGLEWADFSRSSGFDAKNQADVDAALTRHDLGSVVVHYAAYADVMGAESVAERENPAGNCFQLNVGGTENIARACAAAGKHLVYVSTVMVFGGEQGEVYDEQAVTEPVGWYGRTKLQGEDVVRDICGDDSTIVRVGFAFRSAYEPKTDIVRRTQQHLTNRPGSTLPPQFDNQILVPVFVDDIAEMMKVIVAERPGGVLHAVGGTALSSYELARKVAELTDGADPSDVARGDFANYYGAKNIQYPQYLDVTSPRTQAVLGLPARDIDSALEELVFQQRMQHAPVITSKAA